MKTLILILIFLLFSTMVFAQAEKAKIKIYKTKVKLMNNKKVIKGTFYAFTDSIIMLIDAKTTHDIINGRFQFHEVPVGNIKNIKVRRKGQIGTFALLGVLAGAASGTVLGLIQGDDLTPCNRWGGCLSAGDKAIMYALPFSIIGAALGGIIGAPHKHFVINGNSENFKTHQEKLDKYAINKTDVK
jgi:hypothetical protein